MPLHLQVRFLIFDLIEAARIVIATRCGMRPDPAWRHPACMIAEWQASTGHDCAFARMAEYRYRQAQRRFWSSSAINGGWLSR